MKELRSQRYLCHIQINSYSEHHLMGLLYDAPSKFHLTPASRHVRRNFINTWYIIIEVFISY